MVSRCIDGFGTVWMYSGLVSNQLRYKSIIKQYWIMYYGCVA